jgi:hypothetical protein
MDGPALPTSRPHVTVNGSKRVCFFSSSPDGPPQRTHAALEDKGFAFDEAQGQGRSEFKNLHHSQLLIPF